MKAIIYGSTLCPDCVAALAATKEKGLTEKTEFRCITDSLAFLKEFLALRERAEFLPVKAAGGIGIPVFVLENGTVTLSEEEAFAALAE